ncbi:MAG TPA: PDDEXK nuclease domain-containing protein [Polyangiaceae bacterium]
MVTPEEEIKEPYVLEFLDLTDEYSETDLEAALIAKLEGFLLELGGDFTFVGRQRRLRVGDEWYRIDLFFFRRLRCLVTRLSTKPLRVAFPIEIRSREALRVVFSKDWRVEHRRISAEVRTRGTRSCAQHALGVSNLRDLARGSNARHRR